jgi:hypothetical protein
MAVMEDKRLIVEKNERNGRTAVAFIFAPLAAPVATSLFMSAIGAKAIISTGRWNELLYLPVTFIIPAFLGYIYSALLTIPPLAIFYPLFRRFKLCGISTYLIATAFIAFAWSVILSNRAGSFHFLLAMGCINCIAFWLIERPDKP